MDGVATGKFIVDWALMSVTLFNAILLLWLGIMVLLNAERRTWAVWLAGLGLLMGGVFFISHAALLGHGLEQFSGDMNFWWQLAWLPVIGAPLAWYVVMLWYSGFWQERPNPLFKRQALWFAVTLLLALAVVLLLVVANPVPTYVQVWNLKPLKTPNVAGMPLLFLVYSAYMVLCILLSLDALSRPGPTGRLMGDVARRRARPWLISASYVQLIVSLLAAWVMNWIVLGLRSHTSLYELAVTMIALDLSIAALLAVAILLVGQAIVAYEVFTGKSLPRRGFRRQWISTIILAAGYGLVVGLSLALGLRQVYSLLSTTLLMTIFYALFNWRTHRERELYVEHLRPFVASQHLYDYLMRPSTRPEGRHAGEAVATTEVDAGTPFRALCEEVLAARVAYLIARGPLASLVGAPLSYPEGALKTLPSLSDLESKLASPSMMCVALDPREHEDLRLAVPLWSERGLIGVLLLGDKQDGGVYTQEEIEIARSSGERLIDTIASARIAQRLMALQRQRIAESQVLDHQTRRLLHDDILPQLHTAMLSLSGQFELSQETARPVLEQLAEVHRRVSDLLHSMPSSRTARLAEGGVVQSLRQLVEEEMTGVFDTITWEVEEEAESQAGGFSKAAIEVLFYAARELLRNAGKHARGSGLSHPLALLVAVLWREGLELVVQDNGVGMEAAKPPAEGSGQGLTLHGTMMAVVGGTLSVESSPGEYTRMILFLPEGA